MGVVVVPTTKTTTTRRMPPVLVVAIVASIFAAAASPTAADAAADAGPKPLPLVENLPTTVAAQDFIRARCNQAQDKAGASRRCYELLLPYATSINGSYNRAATAGVTVMVSKLNFLLEDLAAGGSGGTATDPPQPADCIQLINGAINGAKEEILPKLERLDAMGDDKVLNTNTDLTAVDVWIIALANNVTDKCRKDGRNADDISLAKRYIYFADGLVFEGRPYWDNTLPSPDGSGP